MDNKVVDDKFNKWGLGITLPIILILGVFIVNKVVNLNEDKIKLLEAEIAALKEKQDATSYLVARTDLDSQEFFEKLLQKVNSNLDLIRTQLGNGNFKDEDKEALVKKFHALLNEKELMLSRMESFSEKQNDAYQKLADVSKKVEESTPAAKKNITLNDEFEKIVEQSSLLSQRLIETNREIENSKQDLDVAKKNFDRLDIEGLEFIDNGIPETAATPVPKKSVAMSIPPDVVDKKKSNRNKSENENIEPIFVTKKKAHEIVANNSDREPVIATDESKSNKLQVASASLPPIQSNTANGFQFDLLQCKKKVKAIKCVFRVVNNKEEDYLVLNNLTRSFDEKGNLYKPGVSSIVDAKIDLQRGMLIKRLKSKDPVEMSIEFTDFPPNTERLTVIDLVGSRGTDSQLTTKFINVRVL